jgi:uncharacterized protein YkwD
MVSTCCTVLALEDEFRNILDEKGSYTCLSTQEVELLGQVNTYRASHGLPVITSSRSLNMVARVHVMDLYKNRPTDGKDIHGERCNLHSWSYNGFWTPVCYTKEAHNPEGMWHKTKEITNYVYNAVGYEIAYWTSEEINVPSHALEAWKKSPTHNALILETGIWKGLNSKAIGVGLYKGYAVVWVGQEMDTRELMEACSNQGKNM